MHWMIEHDEQRLHRSAEAVARRIAKLDWPISLVKALENGRVRELHGWELSELHHYLREVLS